jgi:hypothetical protein
VPAFTQLRVDKHIEGGLRDGQFVASQYCYLCAGPPRLKEVGGPTLFGQELQTELANRIVYPIAGTQAYNLSGNKAIQRLFEIGSHRSYWLPSHTVQQLMLNRVYYHGASLLRLLYAYYSDPRGTPSDIIPPMYPTIVAPPNPHDVIIPPGYENIFLALASDLFDQPFGLLLYIRDSNENTMGAFYLESAMVPSHNWATDSMGGAVQESAVIQFEWMVPVQVNLLPLVTDMNPLSSR